MGDAQALDVVQARGNAGGGLCAGFSHTQELSLVVDAGAFIDGQVTDVNLVDHGVGESDAGIGIGVMVPAFGIGGLQIQDHGALAVDAGGDGVGIAGLVPPAFQENGIGVITAVQIAVADGCPGTLDVTGHGDLFQQIISSGGAGLIEVQDDFLGGRSPNAESGLLRGPDGAQIGTGIGISGFKFRSREMVGHYGCSSSWKILAGRLGRKRFHICQLYWGKVYHGFVFL